MLNILFLLQISLPVICELCHCFFYWPESYSSSCKCTGVVVVCSHSFYMLSIQLLKKLFQSLLLYIMREMLHSLAISFSQFIKGNPLDLQPWCHQVLLSKEWVFVFFVLSVLMVLGWVYNFPRDVGGEERRGGGGGALCLFLKVKGKALSDQRQFLLIKINFFKNVTPCFDDLVSSLSNVRKINMIYIHKKYVWITRMQMK